MAGQTKNDLIEKLKVGRPVAISPEEGEMVREEVRRAMAITLACKEGEIADEARIFDELGLDSVDVFDLVDQLVDTFEMTVELDQLPEEMIYGRDDMTFHDFADGLIRYFQSAPEAGGDQKEPDR